MKVAKILQYNNEICSPGRIRLSELFYWKSVVPLMAPSSVPGGSVYHTGQLIVFKWDLC